MGSPPNPGMNKVYGRGLLVYTCIHIFYTYIYTSYFLYSLSLSSSNTTNQNDNSHLFFFTTLLYLLFVCLNQNVPRHTSDPLRSCSIVTMTLSKSWSLRLPGKNGKKWGKILEVMAQQDRFFSGGNRVSLLLLLLSQTK